MPKIVISKQEDAALRKVAPSYLRRTTQRVRWAIEQVVPRIEQSDRKPAARRTA